MTLTQLIMAAQLCIGMYPEMADFPVIFHYPPGLMGGTHSGSSSVPIRLCAPAVCMDEREVPWLTTYLGSPDGEEGVPVVLIMAD